MVFDPLFAVRLWWSSWNWYSPKDFILGVKNLCLMRKYNKITEIFVEAGPGKSQFD